MKDDLISRRKAIKAIEDLHDCYNGFSDTYDKACIIGVLEEVPSAQPRLYGYKIEHLAFIATVMQKKGITAEKAVEIFGDIGRACTMLIEEIQNKVNEEMERWMT